MNRIILILALGLGLSSGVSGQVGYEISGSLGGSTILGYYGNSSSVQESLWTGSYGITSAIRLPMGDFTEMVIGLRLALKGTRHANASGLYRTRSTALDIPLYSRVFLEKNEERGFFFNFGIYGSLFTNATNEIGYPGILGHPVFQKEVIVPLGNDPDRHLHRRFDMGSTFGFGTYFGSYQVSFDVNLGMLNPIPGEKPFDGLQYRTVYLTFAHRFDQ